MNERVLIGQGSEISSIPRREWEEAISQVPDRMKTRLNFMTSQHHRIRYYVVREIPRVGKSIQPKLISEQLKLPMDRVNKILRELEENLFFLVRNKRGHVSWAFPVTAQRTPHRLRFSSGERTYAA